jgi:hypothetical protein
MEDKMKQTVITTIEITEIGDCPPITKKKVKEVNERIAALFSYADDVHVKSKVFQHEDE